ncbi:hypothetical protein NDA18_004554 [Ustilago nuda]|nr:hypothetical protein NDA18_004554 [Ustilago nuda]
MNSRYHTRSRAAATSAPPPPPSWQRIVVQLRPREALAPEIEPPVSPVPAQVADPLASPVAPRSPLEPLFLGMGDDVVTPSPLPSPYLAPTSNLVGNYYSPASPKIDLYEVDARHPAPEMSTLEHQVVWEAELICSPTPPPTADEVIDRVLEASRAETPVFRPEVQPLTPPPRWMVSWD